MLEVDRCTIKLMNQYIEKQFDKIYPPSSEEHLDKQEEKTQLQVFCQETCKYILLSFIKRMTLLLKLVQKIKQKPCLVTGDTSEKQPCADMLLSSLWWYFSTLQTVLQIKDSNLFTDVLKFRKIISEICT